MKNAIYKSNLEGFEGFLNASAGFCKHLVRALTILYTLIKTRVSWKLLIVVNMVPFILSQI